MVMKGEKRTEGKGKSTKLQNILWELRHRNNMGTEMKGRIIVMDKKNLWKKGGEKRIEKQ